MKHKKKWITIKEENNGIRVKTSTNITAVNVIDMLTAVICKILVDTAKLNSLNVTSEKLAEEYKNYMLKHLHTYMEEL